MTEFLYFEPLLDAIRNGYPGRDVHFGLWNCNPPNLTFSAAQENLTREVVSRLGITKGERVLDLGCGVGGTMKWINSHFTNVHITGINSSIQQLEICKELVPIAGNSIDLRLGDACKFKHEQTFDKIVCLEAMFHFDSRRECLQRMYTALRPGGTFVGTDILFTRGNIPEGDFDDLIKTLQFGYGPWPQPELSVDELVAMLSCCGFIDVSCTEVTKETISTHEFTAPRGLAWDDATTKDSEPLLGAACALRTLHHQKALSYVLVSATRPVSSSAEPMELQV
ncbi:MAG: hypothetical protein CMJ82_04090 [Planctomycetaceae bacterium]|nr:hypothetical protein [Planctomycetaceae bacterium]